MLTQAFAMYDGLAQRLVGCEAKIEALLVSLGHHQIALEGASKPLGKNTPRFDLRRALVRWGGVDLTRINGLAITSGTDRALGDRTDLSCFANVKHFCSCRAVPRH